MPKYCLPLVFFLFFAVSARTFAGDPQPVSYLGIEDGLSNNSVTSIFQDHRGFIWFGTYDGLNRYDGYYFKVFRNHLNDSSSLPNNRIAVITEDNNKRLWIGTRSGVALYDQVTASFHPVYCLPQGKTSPQKITAIVNQIRACGDNNVFIATDNGLLLYRHTAKAAVPVTLADQSNYQAMAIEEDAAKRVWVYVREKGLYLYDDRTQSLHLVCPQIRNGICLKRCSNGSLFLGTDDGLYEYSARSNAFTRKFASDNRVMQLAEYDNTCYIVTDGNGVFVMDQAMKEINPLFENASGKSLTSPCVYSVLKDRDGRLWIGTMRGGVNIIDVNRNKFKTIAHNGTHTNQTGEDFVTCIAEDSAHNLWIGTDGNGLSYWNAQNSTFNSYGRTSAIPQSRCSNFITDVLNEDDTYLWIASWGGGVDRLNKRTHVFEPYKCINTSTGHEDRNAFILYKDRLQRIWAGTCLEGGLYRLDPQTKKMELYDARLKNILAMYQDMEGKLWAGDFSALIEMDESKKTFKRHELGFAVRSIMEDKSGNFWVGTEGGGLLLYNRKTGTYTRYDEQSGLSNNSVLKVLEDEHHDLWISTFNGISVFNTITRKFRNFSQTDGLQSNQFTYNAGLKLNSGQMAFGGIKGMNIFNPDSVLNKKSPPLTTLLIGLKIDNAPVETGNDYIVKRCADNIESVKLPFNKAVLSIDYAALDYSSSGDIRYAYFLEGWDKSWNYVGPVRTANYTRLNEGVYTFHVKAIDAEGNEHAWAQNLVLEVLPPWYRTWWAYLIYISMGCMAIYVYVRYKAQQAKQEYEIALARVETEKEKELNEKKLLFFTNIAHEFRTPLTLIIDPVKELMHDDEKRKSGFGLQVVYRNARRLLSLVDQLLLFRKADTEGDKLHMSRLNFYELCKEVFICFSEQAKMRSIQYEFFANNTQCEISCDREKIEIVLYNLLSNALKFTPAGGKVKLEINEVCPSDGRPAGVEVIVTDTGCGIEKGTGDKLFQKFYQAENSKTVNRKGFGIGLYLANQFVKAHGGSVSYESIPGQGTTFMIRVPANIADAPPEAEDWKVDEADRRPVLVEELIADLETGAGAPLSQQDGQEEQGAILEKDLSVVANIVSEKKSVLIIDDNQDIREYLSRIFADKFLVYEAENGEEGLKMARQRLPDIIICDVIMSGVTGVEFCKSIKGDSDLSHIPVILLTASTSSEIKLKGLECGADDYITKPFEKELLVARVENILKNRSTLQQYFLDVVTLRKNNIKVAESYRDFLENCISIIEKEIDNENFTVKSFARAMGMSHSNLYRKVKSISGLSLNTFTRFLRLRKAALLLLSTDMNINEAAGRVGMTDIKYFRQQFHQLFGMNPSEYVKRYKSGFNNRLNIIP